MIFFIYRGSIGATCFTCYNFDKFINHIILVYLKKFMGILISPNLGPRMPVPQLWTEDVIMCDIIITLYKWKNKQAISNFSHCFKKNQGGHFCYDVVNNLQAPAIIIMQPKNSRRLASSGRGFRQLPFCPDGVTVKLSLSNVDLPRHLSSFICTHNLSHKDYFL